MDNVTTPVVDQSPVVTRFKELVASQKADGSLLVPEKVWEKDGPAICAVTIEAANKWGNRFKVKTVNNPDYSDIVGAYVKTDRRLTPGGVLPGRMSLYFVKAVREFTPTPTSDGQGGMRTFKTIKVGDSDLRLF